MNRDESAILSDLGWSFLRERANLVMLRLDKTGAILDANHYALALTGLSLAGKPLSAMLLNSAGEFSPQEWLTSSSQLRLMNIQTASGLTQTLRVNVAPVGEDFVLFGLVDTEEQARLSREVLQLNQELCNLGRELALKNAELAVKNEELAKLNALKNQFLGMAAHDLRKPIGVILNYAEFVMEEAVGGLTPEHLQFLQTICRTAGRMSQVIADFLVISVIEAGHLSLDAQEASLADMVGTAQTLVSPIAIKRKIRFATELDPAVERLFVDGPKIEQVLTNLLSNAVEHSPEAGCVRIMSQRSGNEVRVAVTDEGKGIAPAQRQRLFEAFEESQSPKPSGERSIGLGLTIVRKVIEAHDGRVFVESEPGHGATFGFILPVRIQHQTQPITSL